MADGMIDVHFHLIPQFYRDAVYEAGRGPAIGRYPDWSPQLALDLMDKHGIALAITSLAQPGVSFLPADQAASFARRVNDYAAQLIAQHPRRFGCFGLLPMHDMDAAISEARYCLETLAFRRHFAVRELRRKVPRRFLVRSAHALSGFVQGDRPHSSRAAPVEPIADAAVAGIHDRISVRHHARRGKSFVLRRAGALCEYPLHPLARRRHAALPRLAAFGGADDR